MKNPAVSGGASGYQAGWLDKLNFTAKSQHKQDQPPRQTALLWRIAASLGEPNEALIAADDPVTATDLFNGGRYE
jgi:hypothetical protein